MKFRDAIILSASVPVIVIFLCAIASQYLALYMSKDYIKQCADNLFESQTMFTQLQAQAISQQLNNEVQKFPIRLSLLNQLHSKITSGKVKVNPSYRTSHMHTEMMYENKDDPYLMSLYKRNQFATSNWYHINLTKVSELSQTGQNIIRNISILNPLQRMYKYQNVKDLQQSNRKIQFNNIVQAFSFEGLFYGNGYNNTYRNFAQDCFQGKFKFDARCRYWYKGSLNQTSVTMFQPELLYMNEQPSLASVVCQRQLRYNETLQEDEVYLVACFSLRLSFLSNYFQNFSSKQFYIIDPISQIVVYDSKQSLQSVSSLTDLEFKNLEDQNEARILNQTLIHNYGVSIIKEYVSSNLKDFVNITKQQIIVPYTRNGTKYLTILNPIIYFDKFPQLQGVQQKQPKGIQAKIVFLQINFISDEDLRAEANKLNAQFEIYFNILGLVLIISTIICVCITIIYSIRLQRLFETPIDHLTKVLKKLSLEIQSNQLFDILYSFQMNSKEIFLSKETRQLYESFEIVFQMLIQTTDHFFQNNQTQTLLTLHKQIKFFKQFQNNYAVGIIHNNIGCLLLAERHYFEALEHFSAAILYSQYEIDEFCINNPIPSMANNLINFAQSDKLYEYQEQSKNTDTLNTLYSRRGVKKSSTKQLIRSKFNNTQPNINIHNIHNISQQQQQQQQLQLQKINSQRNSNNHINSTNSNLMTHFKYQNNTTNATYNNIQQTNPIISVNNQNSFSITNQAINQEQCSKQVNYNHNNKYEEVIEESNLSGKLSPLQLSKVKGNLIGEIPEQGQQNKTKYLMLEQNNLINKSELLSQLEKGKEQVQQLFSIYYYRKKNYIISLTAFQEHYDYQIKFGRQKDLKQYNFWKELKMLLKQLLKISKNLEIFEQERIEILTMLSKCYFKQNKNQKSQAILAQSKYHLQSLLNSNQNNLSRQQQNAQNNSKINLNSVNKPLIKVLDFNQSKDNDHISFNQINVLQHNQHLTKEIVSFQASDQSNLNYKSRVNLLNSNLNQENVSYLNVDKIASFNKQSIENNSNNSNKVNKSNQFDDMRFINQIKAVKQTFKKHKDQISPHNFQSNKQNNIFSQQGYDDQLQSINQIQQNNQQPNFDVPKVMNQPEGFFKRILHYFNQIFTQRATTPVHQLSSLNLNLNKKQSERFLFNSKDDQNLIIQIQNKSEGIKESIEQVFRNKRNVFQHRINDNFNELYKKNLELLISFTQIEYLLNNHKLYQGSLLLTSMIESNQQMFSHYPFKIANFLAHIFEHINIQSEEFNQFQDKFVTDVRIKVCFIFSEDNIRENNMNSSYYNNQKCDYAINNNNISQNASKSQNRKNIKNNLKPIQLFSNILDQVLTESDDQISVIIRHNEQYVQTYMKSMRMSTIKQYASEVVSELYSLTQNQPFGIHNTTIPFTEQIEQTEQSKKILQHQQQQHQLVYVNQEYPYQNQLINYTQDQIKSNINLDCMEDKIFSLNNINNTELNLFSQNCIQNIDNFNNSNNNINFDNKQQFMENLDYISPLLQLKSQSKVNNNNKELFVSQDEEDLIKSQHSKSNTNIFSFIQRRERDAFQQLQQENEDSVQYQFKPFKSIGDYNYFIDSSFNDDNDYNQFQYKNMIFHLSMRKSLIESFFDLQQTQQKQIIKQLQQKQYPLSQQNFTFQEQKPTNNLFFNQQNLSSVSFFFKQTKNFIIYSTDVIELSKNELFQRLCECLLELETILLIYSQKRSVNFLEYQDNLTYYTKGKETIKVFYSIQILQNYLESQRSKISKYLYPTYIQHF